jgi:4-hydroxy-tetrahydrodipicolinate synthase
MPNATSRPEIIVAAPIAFDRDGALHLDSTRTVFRRIAASGVDGALIAGTTGEFVALSEEERGQILQVGVEEFSGLRCIAHVGAASAYEIRRLIQQARDLGITEIATLTPYYLPANDVEMINFFTEVADAADGLSLYLYLFTARTANRVSPELLTRLAQLPNVAGAKVSGEDVSTITAYRAAVPDEFVIYTGNDRDLGRIVEAGGQGVVSGVASAIPQPFVSMARLVSEGGDAARIAELQEVIDRGAALIGATIARTKAALRCQGVDAGYPRMPIAEPTEDELIAIKDVVAAATNDAAVGR